MTPKQRKMTLTKLTAHSKNLRIKRRKENTQRNDASRTENDMQTNVKNTKEGRSKARRPQQGSEKPQELK
jgi:hypothetical protein